MLDAINLFVASILDTFRLLFRGRIWLPLLILALVQGAVLYLHHRFFLPPFSGLMMIWLGLFSESVRTSFMHYPDQYILLPVVFGWAKLLVAFLIEGPILFVVAGYFAHEIRPNDNFPLPSIIIRWLKAVVFWLLLNGLWVAVSMYLPELLGSFLDGPKRMLLYSFVILPFLFMLILCPLFYAIPALAVFGDSVGGAFRRSWQLFLSRPLTTFFLSLYVLFVPALLSAIVSSPSRLVEQFNPEIIFWFFVVILVAEMIAAFFWMGTAVRYLLTPKR